CAADPGSAISRSQALLGNARREAPLRGPGAKPSFANCVPKQSLGTRAGGPTGEMAFRGGRQVGEYGPGPTGRAGPPARGGPGAVRAAVVSLPGGRGPECLPQA